MPTRQEALERIRALREDFQQPLPPGSGSIPAPGIREAVMPVPSGSDLLPTPKLSPAEMARRRVKSLRADAALDKEDEDLVSKGFSVASAFAAGGNKGLSSALGVIPDMVNEAFVNFPARMLGHTGNVIEPGAVTANIEGGFNTLGVSTDPSDFGTDFAHRFAGRVSEEVGASVIPGIGLVGRALRQSARRAKPGLLEPLFKHAREKPVGFLAGETAIAASAGSGAASAREIAPESEAAEIIGALVGGFGPAGAVSGTRFLGSQAEQFGRSFTRGGIEREAAGRLQTIVQDRDAALSRLQKFNPETIVDGALLSSAQTSRDPGLLALEQALIRKFPETSGVSFDDALDKANVSLHTALRQAVGGDAPPGAMADFLQDRVGRLEEALDARVAVAVKNAEDQIKTTSPVLSKTSANTIARKHLVEAEADARVQEKELWSLIPEGVTRSTTGIKRRFASDVEDMLSKATRQQLPPVLKKYRDVRLDPEESISELSKLRSDILQDIRGEMANDAPNRKIVSVLGKLESSILETVRTASRTDPVDVAPLIDQARAFSVRLNDKFTRGPVGRLLRMDRAGGQRVPDVDTLNNLLVKGTPGGENARALINAAGGRREFRDSITQFLREDFAEFVADDATGLVKAKRVRDWMRARKPMLAKFPALRTQFRDLESAQEIVDREIRRSKGVKAAVQDKRRSAAAVYLKGDPRTSINRVVNTTQANGQRILRRLVNTAKKDPDGHALEGLREAWFEYMRGKVMSRKATKSGIPRISGFEYNKFIRENRRLMTNSGLFDKEHMRRLAKVTKTMNLVERSFAANPRQAEKILDVDSPLLLEAAGRVIGARVGSQFGSTPLIAAGLGATIARRALKGTPEGKLNKLLTEAVLDKEVMETLLMKITPATEDIVRKRLRGHLLTLGVRAEEREPREVVELQSPFKLEPVQEQTGERPDGTRVEDVSGLR